MKHHYDGPVFKGQSGLVAGHHGRPVSREREVTVALADPDEVTVTLTGPERVTMTSPGRGSVTSLGLADGAGALGCITLALRLVPLGEDEMEQVRAVGLTPFLPTLILHSYTAVPDTLLLSIIFV